jgi:hypothetical protein
MEDTMVDPRIIKPAVYQSPPDDFEGKGHMKVSEVAQRLNLSPEEIFEKLRYRTYALCDYSSNGSSNTPISHSDVPMPPEFAKGYIPEYAWKQLVEGV